MRTMATVRKIDGIRPIPDADAIECAMIGGWTVVVRKGEYRVGDVAVYCEIDSWIPTEVAPFLSKGQEPREFDGIRGERLRTVKLRGQLSQGLLLPFTSEMAIKLGAGAGSRFVDYLNHDVSELLGIKKYEPPIPAQLAGEVKGLFPSIIPKTDQERIQNLTAEFEGWKQEKSRWEITEKLDGSSMTAYMIDGEFGVCSRNLDLKRSTDNSLWKAAYDQSLEEILESYDAFDKCDIALQGELIGEGIQGNPYKIKGQQFFLFDVYLISEGRYMTPSERHGLVAATGIKHVPLIDIGIMLNDLSVEKVLETAEGKSQLNGGTEREGLVFKRMDAKTSFKAISNKFLIKNGG